MKLLKELKKKPFANDLHYLLLSSLLFMLAIKYYVFIAILIFYLIFLFLKKKMIISSLIIIFVLIFRLSIYKIGNDLENGNYNIKIIDVDNNSYIGYIKNNKVIVNEYNHNYKPGDTVNLDIIINDISKSYETDFDYQSYLYSKNIKYSLKGSNSKLIKNGYSLYSLKFNYLKYLNKNLSNDSYNYVEALVFGDNNLEEDIKDSYGILGISHILAISGLHILLLFKFLSFILYKLFHYYHDLIPISLITIFVVLIGMPSSTLRALLFLIIGSLNKYGKRKYTKLDILSISFILMLFISPYLCFQSGFLLSFLVSFILIFSPEIIGKNKYKIIKLYKSYILIFFITLPIVVNFNNNISILSILLSPILSLILAYILVPISYLLAIFPIFDYVFKYVFIFLNSYILNLGNILPLIKIQSFNIYMILMYYIFFGYIIYSLLKKEHIIKSFVYLCSYIILIINIYYINPVSVITFIDCGQGDSSLIRLPYDRGIMVIDAYNSIDYLKSTGIKKIDYLVLTHSDNDHIGDYLKIIKEYDVDNILYPSFDLKFDELLNDININKIGINDKFKFNDNNFKIDILGPINKYDDANSNSIVLKIKIYNKTFLYTGDMTIEEELDLINKYNNLIKSNVLKVGHHGSLTSTSDKFLELVNPDISIISVGLNNNYNLPNKEIINKLNKTSKVYETRCRGNINIFVYKKKLYVSTYK